MYIQKERYGRPYIFCILTKNYFLLLVMHREGFIVESDIENVIFVKSNISVWLLKRDSKLDPQPCLHNSLCSGCN